MHKNKTLIIFIFSVITLMLSSGAFVLFFVIIKNKNEHISAVLTNLEDRTLKKLNIGAVMEKVHEVEETQKIINSYFVDQTQMDSFVNYLENLGTISNTTVKVESVAVPTQTKNIINVKMSVEGNFSSNMRTLKLLENAPYKISVQQVFFSKITIPPVVQDPKNLDKPKEVSNWHTDISFSVIIAS